MREMTISRFRRAFVGALATPALRVALRPLFYLILLRPMRALVTGGNRGLGLEVCRIVLAGEPGSTVFLGCRDLAAGREAARELQQQANGGTVEAVVIDVSSEASIASAVASVQGRVLALDLLVNNAGILHESWSVASAAETMQVNFAGTVAVTTAFLPLIDPGGAILSTSSGVGARTLGLLSVEHRAALSSASLELPALRELLAQIVAQIGADGEHPYHAIPTVAYGLSKLGVNCYTQILARAHPALRVNALSPCDACASRTADLPSSARRAPPDARVRTQR